MVKPLVKVTCDQGIERLIQLGRTVAAARAWGTHPLAQEAAVGLWLDLQLQRAALRQSVEVVEGRVGVDCTQPPARFEDDTQVAAYQALETLQRTWGTIGQFLGIEPDDDLTILNAVLPREAGALPVFVVVALVAVTGATVGAGWWKWVDHLDKVEINHDNNQTRIKMQAADTAEATAITEAAAVDRQRQIAQGVKPEDVRSNPLHTQRLRDIGREAAIREKALTAPAQPMGAWNGLTRTTELAVAAFALWIFARK